MASTKTGSRNARGNKDKKKTRDWYRVQGYTCEYTEILQTIFAGPGKLFYKKYDLFAADGIAMNGKEIIFWNSKSRIKDMVSDLKKFEQFPFPKFVTLEITVWEPRAKFPHILRKMNDEVTFNFRGGKPVGLIFEKFDSLKEALITDTKENG